MEEIVVLNCETCDGFLDPKTGACPRCEEHTRRLMTKKGRRDIAHGQAWRAKQRGELEVRPCVLCGSDKAEMHHEDYMKPLEVVWLCKSCHAEWHKAAKQYGWSNDP